MPAIEAEGLTKRFGEDVLAVDDLDLVVDEGEVFGFLGPNGAGKSTTINMLLGFLSPTAGSIRVLDRAVTSESRAIRKRTGLLPEGWEPYPNLTGREHVASAIDAKGADDDPDHLLDRVGLDPDDARRPAREYSTGMRQRMSLAVSLVGDPDLLIFDEPSAGLDPDGVALLREIIREERERGATVFFSSHILEEVEKVCDRVGILDGGELVALDTIENLRGDLRTGATVTATLDAVPPDLAAGEVSGVRDVTVDGGTVTAEVGEPGAKMRLLRHLDERATVEDVAIEEASLEALFEEYTNDDEAPGGDDSDLANEETAPESAATTGGESA
ncbi:MAG: ATP-binding cassette domain-containing protein [Halobacteriales archaeon]